MGDPMTTEELVKSIDGDECPYCHHAKAQGRAFCRRCLYALTPTIRKAPCVGTPDYGVWFAAVMQVLSVLRPPPAPFELPPETKNVV